MVEYTGSNGSGLGFSSAYRGALDTLSGGRSDDVEALVRSLTPAPREISGAELALQFFSNMAANASQPGSTVLSSAASAVKPTADEYIRQVEANRKAQEATGPLAISLAKALKPDKVTPLKVSYVKVINPETNKVEFKSGAQADALGWEAYTEKKGSTTRMDVILKGVDNTPGTSLNESITSILASNFDKNLHIPASALETKGTGVGEELIEMGAVIVDGKPQIDASGFTLYNYNIVDQAGNIRRTEIRPKIDSLNTIELWDADGFSDTAPVGTQKEIDLRGKGYIFTSKPPEFKGVTLYRGGIAFDGDDIRSSKDEAELIAMDWSKEKPVGFDANEIQIQSSTMYENGTILALTKDGESRLITKGGEVITDPAERERILDEAVATGIKITSNKAGGRRAAVVSVNMSLDAFKEIGKSRKNLYNLREAKRLLTPKGVTYINSVGVEVTGEGAKTGAIEGELPNWRASTIALANIQNNLGLDVIGSVTFGALSQGELDLALDTGLPTGMNEPQLIDWIERKIAAQNKLNAYYNRQATFLSDGDKTIGDWLRLNKEQQEDDTQILIKQKENNITYDFPNMTPNQIYAIGKIRNTLTASQKKKLDERLDELLKD
jgi:hypothetical protein